MNIEIESLDTVHLTMTLANLRAAFAAFLILVSSTLAAQSATPTQFTPGLSTADFEPVTPEESERGIRARRVPVGVAKSLQLHPDSGAPLTGAPG